MFAFRDGLRLVCMHVPLMTHVGENPFPKVTFLYFSPPSLSFPVSWHERMIKISTPPILPGLDIHSLAEGLCCCHPGLLNVLQRKVVVVRAYIHCILYRAHNIQIQNTSIQKCKYKRWLWEHIYSAHDIENTSIQKCKYKRWLWERMQWGCCLLPITQWSTPSTRCFLYSYWIWYIHICLHT